MRLLAFLSLSLPALALATNHPLRPPSPLHDSPLPPRTPSHIFSSLLSTLHHLPSTLHPNGFSLFLATLPLSTPLYHARDTPPPIPRTEWTALDPEMSFSLFGARGGETFLHTFLTTRPLRILVFDGMSSMPTFSGSQDAQDLFLYGRVRPPSQDPTGIFEMEYQRAWDLCEWGEKWGVEGVARMNIGWEVAVCDLEFGGVRQVSVVNATSSLLASRRALEIPWADPAGWEWVRSGSWHERGEGRIRPEWCAWFTFYDPGYGSFPRLETRRDGRHRLEGVTGEDARRFREAVGEGIRAVEEGRCSGVDWGTVVRGIVDRFGGRLWEIRRALESGDGGEVRRLAFAAVLPWVDAGAGVERGVELCMRAYTSGPEGAAAERVVREAVEGVMGEVCGFFVDVHYGVREGEWVGRVERLMEWLDWDEWRGCAAGGCPRGEVCVARMWPVLGLVDEEPWREPRCVNSSIMELQYGGGDRGDRRLVE